MRNRRSGPPQLRSFIASYVACTIVCSAATAQTPSGVPPAATPLPTGTVSPLRATTPTTNAGSRYQNYQPTIATPSAASPYVTAPTSALPTNNAPGAKLGAPTLLKPSNTVAPLTTTPSVAPATAQPAALIPTVPPAGGAVPTQLKIISNAPGNGAASAPSTLTPANTTPADPTSNQLEIRRPGSTSTATIVTPSAAGGGSNPTAPTAGPAAVRLMPSNGAGPAPLPPAEVRILPTTPSIAPSLNPTPPSTPLPSSTTTPSANGFKIPTQPSPTAIAVPTLSEPPTTPLPIPSTSATAKVAAPSSGSITPAAPVAIGGDESVGPLSIPVAPPLNIGGKKPAPITAADNELPASLPGLPQVGPLAPETLSATPSSSTNPLATNPLTTPAKRAELEAIDFNGVTLGLTTLEDVLEAWGQPLERNKEGTLTRCRYAIPPFAGVDIAFRDGTSLSIIIDLGGKFPQEAVAQELGIVGVSPISVEDDKGKVLGLVYPERGTSFRFSPDGDQQVIQIGLDQIDPRPFVLRAEKTIGKNDTAALADVETAIKLDSSSPRAHWLKARILASGGRRREALAAAEAAIERDPKGAEYLLTRAALLAEAGLFDAALTDGQTILNGTPGSPHLQARAWMLRGDLLADGPTRDYGEAIDAHTRAVRLAEPLVSDPRPSVRRAAKELLIDAHLAIANDVAWGNWQQKDIVVPQWLEKAHKLSEAWIASGDLSPEVRLTVARKALTACVGVQGVVDPGPWIDQLQQVTTETIAKCDDPLRRRRLQYEAGLGLYDALQTQHTRGDVASALKCGEAAVDLLAQGREGREETPTDPYRYGRLYFRIGSLYAVKRQDHAKAVEWFDRAAPLLERPLPESATADRGRQGETLVSMGVSYWAVGKRERAMELTNTGSRYMQLAAADGTIGPETLAVPYTNLSVMHRQLGDEATGKRFSEMAVRAEAASGLRR